MTATYFLVGRAVVEFEQKGAERAAYGAQLLERLGADLSARFGRGFSPVNLGAMRLFYLTYVDEISQALSKKSPRAISQTPSKKSELETLAGRFPLPWSQYAQMHLYLNYAREHWTHPDENPPVGLILSTRKNAAVAKYALGGLSNKVLVGEYLTTLPDEKVLADEVAHARAQLESRKTTRARRTTR